MAERLPQIASLEEEEEAISALKARLQAAGVRLPDDMVFANDTDATLLRFIRARKLNIEDTFKMITGCVKWRQEADVRRLLISPMEHSKMEVIRQYRPSSYVGFDKQGRPVFVDRPGLINYDKIWEAGLTDDDILKFHISEMEYMGRIMLSEASRLKGHTVDSVTVIMDMSGLSMRHFTKQSRELFKQILKTDSDNYPETNAGTYIVNVSWVFQTIWKFVSSVIDARTAAKIQVLGSGPAALPILQQVIDPSVIPDFLGGENKYDSCRAAWAKRMDREISAFAAHSGPSECSAGQVTSFSESPATPKASVKQSPLASLRRSLSRGKRAPGRSKSERYIDPESKLAARTASDTGGSSPSMFSAKKGKRRTWFASRRQSSKSSLASGDCSDAEPDCQHAEKDPAAAGEALPDAGARAPSQHPLPEPDEKGAQQARAGRLSIKLRNDDDSASLAGSEQMDPDIAHAISRIDTLIAKVRRTKRATEGRGASSTGEPLISLDEAAGSMEVAPRAWPAAVPAAEQSTAEDEEAQQTAMRNNSHEKASGDTERLCYRMELSGSPGAVSTVLRRQPTAAALNGGGRVKSNDDTLVPGDRDAPRCACAIQ